MIKRMIDLHMHILPGLDDGARTLQDALDMARISCDSGVGAAVASSHFDADLCDPHQYLYHYSEIFTQFQRKLAQYKIPLKIFSGMELMVNDSLLRYAENHTLPGIRGGRILLVEFDFGIGRQSALNSLTQLLDMGYGLILAHPERYDFTRNRPWVLKEFSDLGILLQVNKGSLFHEFGRHAFDTAEWLLRRGMADAVGSDAHDPVLRTPDMSEVEDLLDLRYGYDASSILLEANPREILNADWIHDRSHGIMGNSPDLPQG